MTELDEKRRRHRNERIVAAAAVVVLIAGVVAFSIWNARDEEAFRRETTYIPKPDKITPEVLLLRDYVRIKTTAGKEIDGARWLVQQLARSGVEAEIIESAPGHANVYARIKGKSSGQGLMLLHHIDVVRARRVKRWQHPPYQGVIHLNFLWGRGALDMKGIGVCQLLAFAELARSGQVPERDIVFLAVADEERGSKLGMQWLLEHRPDIFEGVRYALNEGGIIEMKQEKPTYFGIEVGTKLLVTARLAGTLEQLQRARIALEPHMTLRQPHRVLPEVRALFKSLAPYRVEFRDILGDIDAAIVGGEFWRLPPGYRELTQNIVVPRGIRGKTKLTMRVDLYNLPDEDPDARLKWLEETVAPFGVTIAKVTRKDLPAPLTPEDTELFRVLRREAQQFYPGVGVGTEILNNSTNDSRYLRRRGIHCYGIWPFLVDVSQSSSIHRENERIRLDWFVDGVELMKRVVRAYASMPVTAS